jgi:tetratricopeptide (TPR) repeat protein
MARRRPRLRLPLWLPHSHRVVCPLFSICASCEAVVGQWNWFIGGVVTVKPDGTFTQQSGNAGTWDYPDPARGQFTFRWREGGFVNKLVLSADRTGLSSANPAQMYVTAQRIGVPSSPPSPAPGAAVEAKAHYDRGVDFLENGKFDEAIAEFTKAIEIYPKYASAYHNRGNSYYKMGDHARALADLSHAQAFDAMVDAARLDELRKATRVNK